MDRILIGKITSPKGLKGEVKVWNYSDSLDAYQQSEKLYLGDEPVVLEHIKPQKNLFIAKFQGVDDRDAAEALRDREIFVDREELPPLEEGEFYLRDLVGMEVVEDGGETIGKVSDVISNSSQDILKVSRDGDAEVMIPCVEPIIKEIDAEEGRITVELPQGLLEL